MPSTPANWYDHPRLYDIAFGWDPSGEADFLEEAFRRYARRKVQSVFEPFCGTGRIAIALARRGYRVSGVDINKAPVEFARDRCAQLGVEVAFEVADVRDWSPAEPVDAIVTLIDSFRYVTAAESAEAVVRAFHRHLNPGGVLVIGLDVGPQPLEVAEEQQWTMDRDGVEVETTVFDLRKPGRTPGTSVVRSVVHVAEADGIQYEIVTDEEMRTYSFDSLAGMLREHGPFALAGIFDLHYDFDKPLEAQDPTGNIVTVFTRES